MGTGPGTLRGPSRPPTPWSRLDPPASPAAASPAAAPASESETCVMEKRDAGAGETVKRETRPGAAALEGAAGGARAGSWDGVSGKPSPHANPRPANGSAVTRDR